MSTASVLLTVAYDGAAFSGYAPQKTARTVHQVLLAALATLDPSITRLRGVSRTDAGVHARAQRVAFDPERSIPLRGWVLGTNAHLPKDVSIRQAVEVPFAFEPRAIVATKRYRYRVLVDDVRDPFIERRALRVAPPLDLGALRAEAATLVGTHDFAAFRSAADDRAVTVRTVSSVDVSEGAEGESRLLAIDVVGNAFLHNMVRIIVGTLLDVARGRLAPRAVARALQSGDRRDLGITAAAHGLTLEEVAFAGLAEGARWP